MNDWTDHHTPDLAHVATRPATRLAQTTQPCERAALQRQTKLRDGLAQAPSASREIQRST